MMTNFVLTALPWVKTGKNANRRLRSIGQIPAIVYGKATESLSISVNPKEIVSILHSESGRNTVFKLEISEKHLDVLIRDLQIDPIQGNLLHADFQTISMDEKRIFSVPIETVGEAEGVKEGGIVDIIMREIEVECLPKDVPDHIPIAIANLNIGDTFRVSDLQIETEDLIIESDLNLVVVTVVPPKVEVEPEAEEDLEDDLTDAEAGENISGENQDSPTEND